MRTFGLIGKSLSHSYSQVYFKDKFLQNNICDVDYHLFSLATINEIKTLLKKVSLFGFNVTIPYKTEIIPYLDKLDIVAQSVGAVNCVIKQNGKWVGYNTDVAGFEQVVLEAESRRQKTESKEMKAIVLGSGGAAKAVCYVLKHKNIPYQSVTRTKTDTTLLFREVSEEIIYHSTLIINTTPLGMFPYVNERPPIPYHAITAEHILIDLIYNPEETLFLKAGKQQNAFTMNGKTMFLVQADASWELFKSVLPNISESVIPVYLQIFAPTQK